MPDPSVRRPHMPGYGMRGPDKGTGLLPWSWAEERLLACQNFWLATRWPDGRPHVMPVWAVWHRSMLLFSSNKQSRKARNLAADPRCVLTTSDTERQIRHVLRLRDGGSGAELFVSHAASLGIRPDIRRLHWLPDPLELRGVIRHRAAHVHWAPCRSTSSLATSPSRAAPT